MARSLWKGAIYAAATSFAFLILVFSFATLTAAPDPHQTLSALQLYQSVRAIVGQFTSLWALLFIAIAALDYYGWFSRPLPDSLKLVIATLSRLPIYKNIHR